jgi:hypothetical protein
MKVKVDDLAKTVEQTLSDYADDVNDIVKQEIKDAGKEAAKELKETSPKRTGKYAKGWRSTVRKESAVGAEVVVYNKIYRLTHLLEKGHAVIRDFIPHQKKVYPSHYQKVRCSLI